MLIFSLSSVVENVIWFWLHKESKWMVYSTIGLPLINDTHSRLVLPQAICGTSKPYQKSLWLSNSSSSRHWSYPLCSKIEGLRKTSVHELWIHWCYKSYTTLYNQSFHATNEKKIQGKTQRQDTGYKLLNLYWMIVLSKSKPIQS